MLIKVIDEYGNQCSSTYVKRAKGLVKKNRAYWVDDNYTTIRLVTPSHMENLEDKTMERKDLELCLSVLRETYSTIDNYKITTQIAAINLAKRYNQIALRIKSSYQATLDLLSIDEIDLSPYNGGMIGQGNVNEIVELVYLSSRSLISVIKKLLENSPKDNPGKSKEFIFKQKEFQNKWENYAENIQKNIQDKIQARFADLDNMTFEATKQLKSIESIKIEIKSLTPLAKLDYLNGHIDKVSRIKNSKTTFIDEEYFKNYLTELQGIIVELLNNRQVFDAPKNKDEISKQLNQINAEISRLENILDDKENILDDIDNEIDDLENEIDDCDSLIDDLESEIDDIEDEINDLENEITDDSTLRKNNESLILDYQKQILDHQEGIRAQEARKGILKSRINEKKTKIHLMKKMHYDSKDSLSQLKLERNRVMSELKNWGSIQDNQINADPEKYFQEMSLALIEKITELI